MLNQPTFTDSVSIIVAPAGSSRLELLGGLVALVPTMEVENLIQRVPKLLRVFGVIHDSNVWDRTDLAENIAQIGQALILRIMRVCLFNTVVEADIFGFIHADHAYTCHISTVLVIWV